MAKVTIEDISRETGLSRGTVSRALNNRPDINPQTKDRVLSICRKLNYVPSSAARSLATGRSEAVAVLISNTDSRFAAGFIRGVIDRAETANYMVHVLELRPNVAAERIDRLPVDRVDGVLNAGPLDTATAAMLSERLGKRCLVTSHALDGLSCDLLEPDFIEAGRIATRLLLAGGAHRLLYVHRTGDPTAESRAHHTGFTEICQEHAIDGQAATLTIEPGAPTTDTLTERLNEVDGVIAADDHLAMRVMLACATIGKLPGRDLALIGQGNDQVGEETYPTLTTIDYDAGEIGRRAMETLLQRITGERQDAPLRTRVAPRLIQRQTTANLRTD